MKKQNTAQKLLVALGVDDLKLQSWGRFHSYSYTRKGPGIKHDKITAKRKRKIALQQQAIFE